MTEIQIVEPPCTCLAEAADECYQLRHYGVYPSWEAKVSNDEEDCLCICHEQVDYD